MTNSKKQRVVIIGGGFGGLYTAKALGNTPVDVTLIDKRNFHLFQPLLYQVATGGLSPGDISSPLRAVLSRYKNVKVVAAEATDVDPDTQRVILSDGEVPYDTLIVATGVSHHYFGNDEWAESAPGLKTIEDAVHIRRHILLAFEAAERESDPAKRRAAMTFVVVGAGPTGVELAGALAELAHKTLKNDFRNIDPAEAKILLLEGMDRVLPPYPPELSAKAEKSLEKLGVVVQTNTMVTDIDGDEVTMKQGDDSETIRARTVLWAAGVQASGMGKILADRTGVELDRSGRVIVEPDLSLANQPNIFVIGDLAHFAHQNEDKPLPGVAQVAIQQGQYMAKLVRKRLKGQTPESFRYFDKGSLAVIGRNAAVADIGPLKFSGFFAWLLWVFIHIMYLVEFDNRLIVFFQWAWNYVTRKRGARLITGPQPYPRVEQPRPGSAVERERFSMNGQTAPRNVAAEANMER